MSRLEALTENVSQESYNNRVASHNGAIISANLRGMYWNERRELRLLTDSSNGNFALCTPTRALDSFLRIFKVDHAEILPHKTRAYYFHIIDSFFHLPIIAALPPA